MLRGAFVKLRRCSFIDLKEVAEEGDEVEGALHEDVVVPGSSDGDEGLFFRGREVEELFAILEGDDLIFFGVDDEEGSFELFDPFQVGEMVAKEDGDAGDDTEGAEEGGDEDDSAMFLLGGEPAGGAGADGLANEEQA